MIAILVENHSGVLSRVTGLFSRRGYSIDSLSVGTTENETISRITVAIHGDEETLNQIIAQVTKLQDVINVVEMENGDSVFRELTLIKVKAGADKRAEIVGIADIFRASIIDVSAETLTVELTGDQSKLSAFCELMEPFGIMEIARTGLTGLQRGGSFINQHRKFEEE
jgi:acetolactate synthase-1/3 small subunit